MPENTPSVRYLYWLKSKILLSEHTVWQQSRSIEFLFSVPVKWQHDLTHKNL